MQVFNTLSHTKEEFRTIHDKEVNMYVCGPTVYNFIHIGNARPICVFDVFRRFMQYRGYKVNYIQNYTDVNDKIIRQADTEGITPEDCALKYIHEYETDARGLNVLPATVHPKVSEYMPQIIAFIETLIDKGYAYVAGGDVYYRTRRFADYGKLSGQSLDDLNAGARVEINDIKEDPLDFALWKGCTAQEQHWDSPWGPGRPGWHIECSAMAKDCLGDTIDLHCGGADLIFPHHENEIAQSEAANGCEFAHYWMHNGHINVDHKKMSKSEGNFFLTRDVAAKYGYEVIRYLMIQAQYRAPMNYTAELLDACRASLDRLYQCRETLTAAIGSAPAGEPDPERLAAYDKHRQDFVTALEDDLNTADALTAVFELVRELNIDAAAAATPKAQLEAGKTVFEELIGVLGLLYERGGDEEIPQEVQALVGQRAAARKNKDFAEADRLREEIAKLGYAVKETRQGTQITKL
ncbi:MAG: cysteine--tRNA ligase [Oscillospiraceae bacterium]|nr:cysteine--tRNA ligase [Oscillospiraceae bacterium]